MKRPEQALQIAGAKALALMLPYDAWATAIPGGGGGKMHGIFVKARGYKAGTPDHLIIYQGIAHFIEWKSETGRASEEQKTCAADIFRAGANLAICRSLDDLWIALKTWKIPIKMRMSA